GRQVQLAACLDDPGAPRELDGRAVRLEPQLGDEPSGRGHDDRRHSEAATVPERPEGEGPQVLGDPVDGRPQRRLITAVDGPALGAGSAGRRGMIDPGTGGRLDGGGFGSFPKSMARLTISRSTMAAAQACPNSSETKVAWASPAVSSVGGSTKAPGPLPSLNDTGTSGSPSTGRPSLLRPSRAVISTA